MALNKQPIFTATPILVSLGLTPTQNEHNTYNTDNVTNIYTDNSTYGSMITKITVNTNGKIGITPPSQRIDLYVYDSITGKHNCLTSKYIEAGNVITQETPIPSSIFEFTEGLILPPGGRLALSSTAPSEVSIIIEGGTYDEPA
jgi:hypothetical protein